MCQKYNWLIVIGSLCGAIQSILWMGFGIAGALVYLCVVPVSPYKDDNDFFRVTFVKLYFEGPQCIPDGSYLGKFNEDYRTSIALFTPDRVFATMVAYVILNAIYFILSISFYNARKKNDKRKVVLGWSLTTLVLCAVDFILTYEVILDIFSIRNYMSSPEQTDVYTSSARGTLTEISYIPLVLALMSSRFVAFWLWNFLVGLIFFIDALCYRKIIGKPPKPEKNVEKQKEVVEELQQKMEDRATSVSLANGKYYSAFDVRSHPHYLDFKKSMEAVTRFNSVPESPDVNKENSERNRGYAPTETYWGPSKSQSGKGWEMANEGFVSDEIKAAEIERDFDHNLKNFESGPRKIKIVKPPIGKPVSIPVPPPLPAHSSCNC